METCFTSFEEQESNKSGVNVESVQTLSAVGSQNKDWGVGSGRGGGNFQSMIISGGKGPKIVREMEKRCQGLRRKLLNKGGVRL